MFYTFYKKNGTLLNMLLFMKTVIIFLRILIEERISVMVRSILIYRKLDLWNFLVVSVRMKNEKKVMRIRSQGRYQEIKMCQVSIKVNIMVECM